MRMKKLFVVLGIGLCLCFWCAEANRWPILPKAENVHSICIDFTNSTQKLYEKSGFKVEGIRAKSMLVNGELVDEYYMAKIL